MSAERPLQDLVHALPHENGKWIRKLPEGGRWIYFVHVYIRRKGYASIQMGNRLAIRLPAAVVEALSLKEGDSIEIHAAGTRMFEVNKIPGARELLARLRKYRGRLPKDFKFDRLEANERR